MTNRYWKYFTKLLDQDSCILKWSASGITKKNIGDALNPFLFEKITEKKVINLQEVLNLGIKPVYSFIGSVLDNSSVRNLTVIGSGFKREDSRVIIKPKKVVACRGPLTRNKLLKAGVVEVPEIYGDPAILLPMFFDPDVEKTYKFGIIPHYIDHNAELITFWKNKPEVKFIDVFSDLETFVNDLKSCEYTFSSSLHGVILSHAYGVPSVWIKLSEKIAGGNFKFDDYFQSVDIKVKPIIPGTSRVSFEGILNAATLPDFNSLQNRLFKEIKMNV